MNHFRKENCLWLLISRKTEKIALNNRSGSNTLCVMCVLIKIPHFTTYNIKNQFKISKVSSYPVKR